MELEQKLVSKGYKWVEQLLSVHPKHLIRKKGFSSEEIVETAEIIFGVFGSEIPRHWEVSSVRKFKDPKIQRRS